MEGFRIRYKNSKFSNQKSKDLFEELLSDEEKHLNFFENIKNHVEKLGEAYFATLTWK
jgi:bacterioferritin (cytochrome b1)